MRAAFLAAADRPPAPFVRAAFFAAADRCAAGRRLALERACAASARGDAAARDSRRSALVTARDRRRETVFFFDGVRPAAVSRAA